MKQTLVVVAMCAATTYVVSGFSRTVTDATYELYVASEASDTISLVRFGPQGGRVVHAFGTGIMPTDIDGPHGLTMSPDRRFYYVSLAHGQPFGTVLKYSAADDAVVGHVTLGMFPATMQTTPNGEFLYVVNFNLHGDMVPSSVSVVATAEMLEVARIPTCTMPHGSRINPQGTKHYSACMMDDMLVEIDTATLRASRYFVLTKGAELGHTGSPMDDARLSAPRSTEGKPRATSEASRATSEASRGTSGASRSADDSTAMTHEMVGHGLDAPKVPAAACSPTWAQPSADGRSVFVACNASNDIVEVDASSWTMTKRFAAGPGVYNLASTNDGRLVATNKRGQSVSVIDARSGRELARVPTRRRVVHGVVVSPDDRYAFVSVEGVGAEPGTVEMIDLQTLETVATVDVAPQAGGIDFYRVIR